MVVSLFIARIMDNICLFGQCSEGIPASQHKDIVVWLCEKSVRCI